DEEVRVEPEVAARLGVELTEPALAAVGVELGVPARVERVGQVDAAAITAHLDHLGTAVDRAGGRVRAALRDSAEPHAPRLHGVDLIGHVVALDLPGAPAG